jgi:NADPH:quinone reductase-like Zn-dependent oxidoreductase
MSMRAYEINGTEGIPSINHTARSEPKPLRGQILVKMQAWSLNYRDLLIVNNKYGGLKPQHIVALSDGAGTVIAIGPDVRRFNVGDRVTPTFTTSWIAGAMTKADIGTSRGGSVDGVLAELVVCDENFAVRVPDYLSYQEAACLPCAGVTAWNALFGPRPLLTGQTVLTLGTGGVSTLAIQYAHAAGARVIATSSSDEKLDAARRLGASDTVNYKSAPEWQDEVLRLTDGRGVDHVVEVGGGGTIERSIASSAVGGQVHMIGVLSDGTLAPRSLIPWKTLRGIMVGSTADHEAMNCMLELHQIRPLIGKCFSFDEVREAYRYLESSAHIGKVVIEREQDQDNRIGTVKA